MPRTRRTATTDAPVSTTELLERPAPETPKPPRRRRAATTPATPPTEAPAPKEQNVPVSEEPPMTATLDPLAPNPGLVDALDALDELLANGAQTVDVAALELAPVPFGPELPAPSLRESADALAARVGELPGAFSIATMDWTTFLSEGVMVTLHHSRWRATVQLTLEDYGLTFETEEQRRALLKVVKPGTRGLLPDEILKKAQTKTDSSRYWLERCGFKMTKAGRSGSCYVHESRYATWKEGAELRKAEFEAVGQEIYDTWDDLMAQVRIGYHVLANQAWQNLRSSQLGRAQLGDKDWETYVRETVDRLMEKEMPTREEARDSFKHWWDLEVVPLQQQVARDAARAEEEWTLSRARAAARAESEMQLDLRRQERERAKEGLETFVSDLQATIRAELYDVCQNALDGLEDGKFAGNSTRSLKTLVAYVQRMMFWDDQELTQQLARLDRLSSVKPKDRDNDAIVGLLKQLSAESKMVLTALERVPERKTDDGLPSELPALTSLVSELRAAAPVDVALPSLAQLVASPTGRELLDEDEEQALVVPLA